MDSFTESSFNREMIKQRDLCYRCFRAKHICYCSEIHPINTQTKFIILRHKLERKRTIGTALMANLSLTNSQLFTDIYFEEYPQISELLSTDKINKFVLFPSHDSININSTPMNWEKPRIIFVIDGTWADAKRILRVNPKIASLQKISFSPGRLSEYGFRKQPAPHCLSTIESIHHVLKLTEPTLNADHLLHVFRHMVKIQIQYTSLDSTHS